MGSLDAALCVPPRAVEPADCHENATRNVYGLLGLPVDAIDFETLIAAMDTAAAKREPFLISTLNVNFLIKCQQNVDFRDSVLSSDLCLVDGMPLIWMAKFLQVPIQERVAGSDLFGRLKARTNTRLRVFLFGGTGDLAARVGEKLNAEDGGLECVGVLNPGFGSVEKLSSPEIINQINASGADLLAVFLNAEKAQAWLMHNHHRLTVPIRAQFGATINFEAGTIKRAPPFLRSTGFEWLWRIKEEPYLWRRYWNDGRSLIQLFLTSVLPIAIAARVNSARSEFDVNPKESDGRYTLALSGSAAGEYVDRLLPFVDKAAKEDRDVTIDLSDVSDADGRFFGLLLGLRTQLAKRGLDLHLAGISPRMRRIFRLNRFEFLLTGR
ncbi:N-acetylglucosaminyldiphosphoundecaprenol N-acetyl-beta-D-mannosaminyltransferase [Bradyrhizobium sp. AZCC 2230]